MKKIIFFSLFLLSSVFFFPKAHAFVASYYSAVNTEDVGNSFSVDIAIPAQNENPIVVAGLSIRTHDSGNTGLTSVNLDGVSMTCYSPTAYQEVDGDNMSLCVGYPQNFNGTSTLSATLNVNDSYFYNVVVLQGARQNDLSYINATFTNQNFSTKEATTTITPDFDGSRIMLFDDTRTTNGVGDVTDDSSSSLLISRAKYNRLGFLEGINLTYASGTAFNMTAVISGASPVSPKHRILGFAIAPSGGGGGGTTASSSLLYPPNDNYLRLDFTNWVLALSPDSSDTTTTQYDVGVVYDFATSTLSAMRFADDASWFPFIQTNTFVLRKTFDLRPDFFTLSNVEGKTWYAYPFIQKYGTSTITYGSLTTFKIVRTKVPCILFCAPVPSSSILAAPFSNQDGYVSPSSTITYLDEHGGTATTTSPYACNGIFDIAGCLDNAAHDVVNFVIGIPTSVGTTFSNTLASMVSSSKNSFPLGVLISFNSTIQNLKVSTTAPENISLIGQGTAFKKASSSDYYTFTFLTSSTLNASTKTPTGFDIENLISLFLYGATGIAIVAMVLIILRKAGEHNQPKK